MTHTTTTYAPRLLAATAKKTKAPASCLAWVLQLLLCTTLAAQVPLPETFASSLDAMQIDWLEPVEMSYKPSRQANNSYQPCHFGMWSGREKMEIRYLLAPIDSTEVAVPHVAASRILWHLASNDEENYIAMHSISDRQLKEDFNADWGKVWFFKPKGAFSNRDHCKMLALYREGRGMAYTFFLFDQAPITLDQRFFSMRFISQE